MEKVVFQAKQRHYSEFDWFLKYLKGGKLNPHFWTKKCLDLQR